MDFLKRNKQYIALYVAMHVFLFLSFYLTSEGIADKTFYLQMRRYLPSALAVALATAAWRSSGQSIKGLWSFAAVGLLWVLVYPVCYYLSFGANTSFIDNHYDAAFGAYIYSALVALRLLLARVAPAGMGAKLAGGLVGLLQALSLVIPLFQLGYYKYYGTPITEAASMAFIQTNKSEAREYLLQNVGMGGLIALAVGFVALTACLAWANRLNSYVQPSKRVLLMTLVVFVASAVYGHKIFPQTGVMQTYVNARDYFIASEKFRGYHDENFARLQVSPATPKFSKPSTIIMVIGESASREFMSAYGYRANDTTPWLRENATSDNFVVFKHAYTSWGQTVPSLERALTQKNQYNTKEFNQSLTVLDLAKKAGYTTYWFSNQGTMSDADTPITLVAKTADHGKWIADELVNTTAMKYDGDLLAYLKAVDPTKNNFVVLHIMGSHDNYINRYPADFTKFGQPNVYDMQLNYNNSIAYTDWLLEEAYKYGKDKLNLQAMFYFSDHGGDPLGKRHPDKSGFVALRIPFFAYFSDEYKALYPEPAKAMRANEDKYFTNDLMYDFVGGLLGITSNEYNPENSIASLKYKFTRETLTTELGKRKLTEDKSEGKLIRE